MTTSVSRTIRAKIDYPTSDGRPMAETELHRDLMITLIETLKRQFASDPLFYVSGNMLVYYKPDDRSCNLAPDVFVVREVPKHRRDYYLIWEEGHSLDLVIELTSRSTKAEDIEDKFNLYRDRLKVREYFLFDPYAEYLDPPLQGYRLSRGRYVSIKPLDARLPSKVIRLHLERDVRDLRLYDPSAGKWLPTPQEELLKTEESLAQTEVSLVKTEESLVKTEGALRKAEAARKRSELENEKLRRELDSLRRRLGDKA
ncbi:MAG: Uma2 family endonuclease [Gemmataceae bacterium]